MRSITAAPEAEEAAAAPRCRATAKKSNPPAAAEEEEEEGPVLVRLKAGIEKNNSRIRVNKKMSDTRPFPLCLVLSAPF